MKNEIYILTWGTDYLVSNGYSIEHLPEIVLSTPWSTIAWKVLDYISSLKISKYFL